jgi:hypothetical protein
VEQALRVKPANLTKVIVSKTINRPDDDGTYDPYKREPEFAHGEDEKLWELHVLKNHFHPTVRLFAEQLTRGERVQYQGDALSDFQPINFLDKFVYKKSKKRKDDGNTRGGSLMQRMGVEDETSTKVGLRVRVSMYVCVYIYICTYTRGGSLMQRMGVEHTPTYRCSWLILASGSTRPGKHTHTHTHTYIHTYTYTQMLVVNSGEWLNEARQTYTHTHAYIHTYTYTQMLVVNSGEWLNEARQTYTHIHTYIHTYIHIHTDARG